MEINVIYATSEHNKYAELVCQLIYESALKRGTGIAKRTPESRSLLPLQD